MVNEIPAEGYARKHGWSCGDWLARGTYAGDTPALRSQMERRTHGDVALAGRKSSMIFHSAPTRRMTVSMMAPPIAA